MAEDFYFGLTDTGLKRDNNEDSFMAEKIPETELILGCVIDGVGGYQGGEVAAAIAKEEILKKSKDFPEVFIPEMVSAFHQASKAIFIKKQKDKDLNQMACVATLVVADIPNNQFYYAHVGDTRLYLLRDGSLVKISNDHSFVGFLEDSGRLEETAAMKHPKRNEINKALGFTEQIEVDESYIETGQSPFLPGDLLLLCSDGLTDMVDRNQINNILTRSSNLQQKSVELIDAANQNGGRDNITVVLIQNNKVSKQADVIKPVILSENKTIPVKETVGKESSTLSAPVEIPVVKRSLGLAMVLGILCALFLASTIWFYLQLQKNTKAAKTTVSLKQHRNAQEILLQDALNNAVNDTVFLSDTIFKSPVILTDTVHIKQDSLFVFVKGHLILQADASFHGAALSIAPNSKIMQLDSLEFKDFNTAIEVRNTALRLNHVKFINCLKPVQNVFMFSGKQEVSVEIPALKIPLDSSIKHTVPGNAAK